MHMDAQEDLLASEIDADIDAESFMEDVENVMSPRFLKLTSTECCMMLHATLCKRCFASLVHVHS